MDLCNRRPRNRLLVEVLEDLINRSAVLPFEQTPYLFEVLRLNVVLQTLHSFDVYRRYEVGTCRHKLCELDVGRP